MLPDFTEGLQQENANTTRSRRQRGNTGDRRETILSLVEMLLQSDELAKRQSPPATCFISSPLLIIPPGKEEKPNPESDRGLREYHLRSEANTPAHTRL